MIHKGPIAPGMCVLHKCDNRCCVRPSHLFIGSQAANVADMIAKGRGNYLFGPHTSVRGEAHGAAKLTESDVKKIRSLIGRFTHKEIAKRYGVSKGLISHIVIGRNWSHV